MFLIDRLTREQYGTALLIMRKVAAREYDTARRLGYSAADASDLAIDAIIDFKRIVEWPRRSS